MMAKIEKVGENERGRTLYGIRPPPDHVRSENNFTFCFTEELIKKFKVKEGDVVEIIYEDDGIKIKFC